MWIRKMQAHALPSCSVHPILHAQAAYGAVCPMTKRVAAENANEDQLPRNQPRSRFGGGEKWCMASAPAAMPIVGDVRRITADILERIHCLLQVLRNSHSLKLNSLACADD